jgi:hypothetical protein
MSWIEEIVFWLREHEKEIKLLSTLMAAGYVILQYEISQRDAKIARTLEFETRYSQTEVLAAHIELDTFLLNPQTKAEIDAAPVPGGKIMELVQSKGYDKDVLILSDFFSEVTTCVQKNLCHRPTACAVFRDRVVALRNNYFKLFELWEKLWGQNFIKTSYDYFSKCN